jgi:hypothetical protein
MLPGGPIGTGRGGAACGDAPSTSYAQQFGVVRQAGRGALFFTPRRPNCTHLRGVGCRSQVRHFNTQFDPSKTSVPLEYQFARDIMQNPLDPPDVTPGVPDLGDTALGPAPAGSFTISSPYARRVRLTPMQHPTVTGLLPRGEEYYEAEIEVDPKRMWPGIVWEGGTFRLRAGFLAPALDPEVPGYLLHRTIMTFPMSTASRAVAAAAATAYVAGLAAVAAALYWAKPMLLAAVTVTWARNRLSLANCGVLAALMFVDRLWLYWVLVVGGAVDELLAKTETLAPVRNFMWANLALWGVYLLVSPSGWALLPFL